MLFEARRLRRTARPLLTVKKNAACNKGRRAKDEARLIETSAKRSYVPVMYYGSRSLPNAKVICTHKQYLRLDYHRVLVRSQHTRTQQHARMHIPVHVQDTSSFNFIQNYTVLYVLLIVQNYTCFGY